MLEYDRIDISEGIDVNKINASKESDIYQYFKNIGSMSDPYNSYDCHDLMQKAKSFYVVAIVNAK